MGDVASIRLSTRFIFFWSAFFMIDDPVEKGVLRSMLLGGLLATLIANSRAPNPFSAGLA
ncbi:MAG: hypothetical protein WA910_00555 [Sphingopyxis granuli]